MQVLIPVSLPWTALRMENVVVEPQRLELGLGSTEPAAKCPGCAVPSTRVQSRYIRTPADLPMQETAVKLKRYVRRFHCDQRRCRRSIFVERLPEVLKPYARQTQRLQHSQESLGFALGGEAAARLASRLGLWRSADTLIRRIRSAAPAAPLVSPRVLGVDDWAILPRLLRA